MRRNSTLFSIGLSAVMVMSTACGSDGDGDGGPQDSGTAADSGTGGAADSGGGTADSGTGGAADSGAADSGGGGTSDSGTEDSGTPATPTEVTGITACRFTGNSDTEYYISGAAGADTCFRVRLASTELGTGANVNITDASAARFAGIMSAASACDPSSYAPAQTYAAPSAVSGSISGAAAQLAVDLEVSTDATHTYSLNATDLDASALCDFRPADLYGCNSNNYLYIGASLPNGNVLMAAFGSGAAEAGTNVTVTDLESSGGALSFKGTGIFDNTSVAEGAAAMRFAPQVTYSGHAETGSIENQNATATDWSSVGVRRIQLLGYGDYAGYIYLLSNSVDASASCD